MSRQCRDQEKPVGTVEIVETAAPGALDDWAQRIRGQLARTVEGFVAAGRELLAAKDALAHGEFEPMVTQRVGMSLQTADKLMAIARHEWMANPAHVRVLPPSWGTLYELARLPPDEFEAAADAGELAPSLSRREALLLVRGRSDDPEPAHEPDPERVQQRNQWERRVAADTVVRMWASSHRLQEVFRLPELGATAGLSTIDLDAAAKRWRKKHPRIQVPRTPPKPRVSRGAPGPAPDGQKWCSFGRHFTTVEDFGINRSRPDGLSNLCRDHWHDYWAQRAQHDSARRGAR